MSSNKKKFKMERLSPIPAMNRDHLLSEALRTPESPAMATSHKRQRDAYAIESTSSPEFGKLPITSSSSSLPKHRRSRNVASGKASTKTISTPLSGLIFRKSVTVTSNKELIFSDPGSSPTTDDIPPPSNKPSVSIAEDLPIIDDSSPQKPTYSPRHAEIISASTVFPLKTRASSSTATPLGGIINKKTSTMNRSLNDSISILREADHLSEDDDLPKSDNDQVNIESFESPRKENLLSKERTTSSGIFKDFYQNSHRNRNIANRSSLIIEKTGASGVEMSGNERKNRKRALDFNSSTFIVPLAPGDDRLSTVLSLKPLGRSDDLGSNVLEPTSSPLLSSDHEGRISPVLTVKPPRLETDDRRFHVHQPTSSLLLEDHEGRLSPVLTVKRRCPETDDRRLHINQPTSSSLLEEHEGRLSPVLTVKPPCPETDDRRLHIHQPTSSSLLEDHEGRLSPVLTVKPPRLETDDSRMHDHQPTSSSLLEDRDGRLSPFLNLKRPCFKADDCGSNVFESLSSAFRLSPVLNIKPQRRGTGDHEFKVLESVSSPLPKGRQSCLSPVLKLKPSHSKAEDRGPHVLEHIISPPHTAERNCQSPVLEVMSSGGIRSTTPFDDERLSDTDSVIESTPIQSRNKNRDFGGFTASSSFRIENYSPSRTNIKIDAADSDSEVPKIEDFPEEASENKIDEKCDLKFVVVSHDTSSNESIETAGQATMNSRDIVYPAIDDRHSPNLELNYTVRPIGSFESPSKPFKPFSEAVNIDAFGSPDSNASFGRCESEQEQDVPSDDVIEGSTTQEYVEESEQVRHTKRRKKGSLLERVKGVIAKGCASNTLFDYEMKCGLRPNRGKSVSAPLVVVNKPGEPPSFLICKPLKHCKNLTHIERISSFIIVHINKLPPGTCEGSVVLLHFPLSIMYYSELHVPYVLAGNQIVPHPTEPQIEIKTIDTSPLKSIEELSYVYRNPIVSFRAFSSSVTGSLSQAVLCQNLVEESNLYLTILHLTPFHELGVLRKITVLCCDEESQYCWMTFTSEHDIKRATALETLGVLSDCSHVQTKGFSVVDRVRLDKKTKNLISYCSNDVTNGQMIFSVCPDGSDWVISSSEGSALAGKTPSLINDILIRNTFGSRYLLEVHGIDGGPEITLKDSLGQSIQYVKGENASITLEQPVPFFLDGVYFYDGKLFSDEHTRVIARNQD